MPVPLHFCLFYRSGQFNDLFGIPLYVSYGTYIAVIDLFRRSAMRCFGLAYSQRRCGPSGVILAKSTKKQVLSQSASYSVKMTVLLLALPLHMAMKNRLCLKKERSQYKRRTFSRSSRSFCTVTMRSFT